MASGTARRSGNVWRGTCSTSVSGRHSFPAPSSALACRDHPQHDDRLMRINCIGGGPGGLSFALALKKRLPSADITVLERSAAGARQGFGVVISDRLME